MSLHNKQEPLQPVTWNCIHILASLAREFTISITMTSGCGIHCKRKIILTHTIYELKLEISSRQSTSILQGLTESRRHSVKYPELLHLKTFHTSTSPSPKFNNTLPECFRKDPQGHQFHDIVPNGWRSVFPEDIRSWFIIFYLDSLSLGNCPLRQ